MGIDIMGSLLKELEALGFRVRVVSARRLDDLGRALEEQYSQGLFDAGFHKERLSGFDFDVPRSIAGARSLIVVAYADPHVRFTFRWKGQRIAAVVPSTYLHWQEKDKQAEQALRALLEPEGYSVAEARVPKKLLAVQSGLALYGRNNITYAAGLGSYYRLAAFFSDMPCKDDDWQEPRQMERCEDCEACVRSCPAGAIDPARFLLRAERCITFWNEQSKEVPFPAWLDRSWHNCLVGCLHCQRVCPENQDVADSYEDGVEFSEEETGLLMEGKPASDLPLGLVEKLRRADILVALDTFPRNLGVIVEKRGPQPA